MLATCWQHAGNNKAFSQGPEAFIMETGGPFENCPHLSPHPSPHLVLLGARLEAIRAQKSGFTCFDPKLTSKKDNKKHGHC